MPLRLKQRRDVFRVETLVGDQLWQRVKNAQVIVATCIGSGMDVLNSKGGVGNFQRVVIDECTQACEPAALVALGRGCEQAVLVGDHAQLPATVLSKLAQRDGLGTSLFERMVSTNGLEPTLLSEQRRMHSTIAEFPNQAFYGSQLVNAVDDGSLPPIPGFRWPNPDCRVCFVDVASDAEAKRGFSTFNTTEAEAIADAVRNFIDAGLEPREFCVLTPYQAQRAARRAVVTVSTPGGRDLGEFCFAEASSDPPATSNVRELVCPCGVSLGPSAFPLGATVLDLKSAIARAGGPAVAKQRLISGAEILDDPRAPLATVVEGEVAVHMTLVESRRRNLALASQGAQLVGELGRMRDAARKPLLRYDVAFPGWPEGPPSDQIAGVPGQGMRWTRGCVMPPVLPLSFDSASKFQQHLASIDAAWKGDREQSTFLPDPAEVVIQLAGDVSFVEQVGFTYSPYDRNYGRFCRAYLSSDGEVWTTAGEVQIPPVRELPGGEQATATLFVDVPRGLQEEPCKFVKLGFADLRADAWGGVGRRLFFVYVFGF
ncbi:unnamed protein product [Prorocentrum cordatum]|uniref:RNA helicase n=1 Tax=Prorocentrum cordatum TaxID=2364126 RepID=A0ABN9YI57_9DINO|nr:unnamed protein product [Polarella glacialis]